MNIAERVLLIGSTGRLGKLLGDALSEIFEVVGTSRKREPPDGVFYDAYTGSHHLDLSSWSAVVYAAGMTSVRECEANPALSERVNLLGPLEVAREVSERGGYFVFISSSAANEYRDMSENQARDAHRRGDIGASIYGLHKYLAEQELKGLENTLVVRLSKVAMPDWELPHYWVSQLMMGKSIEAFSDHFLSPIPTQILNELTVALLRRRVDGFVEVSACDQCSYLEVAQMFAREIGVNENMVNAVSAGSVLEERHIFRRTLLNSSRARTFLKSDLPMALDVFKRFV